MAGKRIDLDRKIKDTLQHGQQLPSEAGMALSHYDRSSTDIQLTLEYVERKFYQGRYSAWAVRRHLSRLHGMVLVSLIENFERFLKETAGVCVDFLAQFTLDDRFNTFPIQGSVLAAHFGTETLGRSLCESAVWLNCDEINRRFRKILADPFEVGSFYLFPKANQPPLSERGRFETLEIVWQLRHTMVHNVGLITQSDAIRLRLLVKEPVAPNRVLTPTKEDLRYLRQFLDEVAELSNHRIGNRLAELLTTIHADNAVLFSPKEMADRITQKFGMILTVAGVDGTLL